MGMKVCFDLCESYLLNRLYCLLIVLCFVLLPIVIVMNDLFYHFIDPSYFI